MGGREISEEVIKSVDLKDDGGLEQGGRSR